MRGVPGFEISPLVPVQESGYLRVYGEASGIQPQKNSKSVSERGAKQVNLMGIELIAKRLGDDVTGGMSEGPCTYRFLGLRN